MPYYEYQCNECDHKFEVYRKATAPPLTRCPKCRGRVRKIFRPVGIIFKGSGFHVTDYPSKGRKERGKEETAKTHAPKEPARPGKESKE
jgi:putative FmdB family regulatory protein